LKTLFSHVLLFFLEILNTIDYVDQKANGGLILRIHPEEKGKLVCQIGSSDPDAAVKAAQKLKNDVIAIDLNCGCPKPFSVHDGSGAALLENSDVLVSILEALVATVDIPVTCKIRLLPPKHGETSMERTKELLQLVEATGIAAVAIHCRYPTEKPRQPGHWDVFEELAKSVKIPVIANGDVWELKDIEKLKISHPSICSYMIARGAQWNVSVFRKEGPLPIDHVIREYLKLAVELDMPYVNVKYVVMQMRLPEPERIQTHAQLCTCKTIQQICALFDLNDFYKITSEALSKKRSAVFPQDNDLSTLPPAKRVRQ
jgi:tRNA-dihydrouridine synthase 2